MKIQASDYASSDYFGRSVSISGNYAIVGAYADDDLGSASGSAYIFLRDGSTWNQQAKLTASDGEANDNFGWSVDISDDYAIIGAYADDDEGSASGSAYIFKRDDTTWSQWAKLTPGDGASNDNYGYNLSISDHYAIVGAKGNDDQGMSTGSAYLYERQGADWIFKVKLTSADAQINDYFGTAVAVSEKNAIVGIPDGYSSNVITGSAYIYSIQSAPMINQITNYTFDLTSEIFTTGITIVDTDGQDITITARSSDQHIIADTDIDIGNSSSNSYVSATIAGQLLNIDLSLTPQHAEHGSTTITLVMTNAQGLTSTSNLPLRYRRQKKKFLPMMVKPVTILVTQSLYPAIMPLLAHITMMTMAVTADQLIF
ncbi:MAG: alpha beta-propellor repeat-containing integrin [Candidatus Magnetoglobus multicellularis str. Araruama]|uniref:Alpha beta-propellor repeat-containing integrin n=1 Tax=Candidatus Magnetoglobus multicellularis str. Araruama TaxID=890399 RepID=A0A1V1NXL7_9BACT|nr:MAG: alpha beta-propellor repeat-containing integrin [Candidatus Magnetoglobus multicellularis str. Araruama]